MVGREFGFEWGTRASAGCAMGHAWLEWGSSATVVGRESVILVVFSNFFFLLVFRLSLGQGFFFAHSVVITDVYYNRCWSPRIQGRERWACPLLIWGDVGKERHAISVYRICVLLLWFRCRLSHLTREWLRSWTTRARSCERWKLTFAGIEF